MFHFAVARIGFASLWIDYVASESNPADVPSRLHEMTDEEADGGRAHESASSAASWRWFCQYLLT